MASTDIVKYQDDLGNEVQLSPGIIKKYLVSGTPETITDQEVMLYLKLCQVKKFNPFIKDCYLIKYGNSNPATMVTSVDVFKRRMENHPMMDGFRMGVVIIKGEELIYREDSIVPPDTTLIGAWMEVKRKDWELPVRCAVNLNEYQQYKKDGTLNQNWKNKPATMITKCVIGCMGRLAFPSEFQGMYTAEEMAQSEKELEVKEIKTPPTHEEVVAEVEEVFEGEVISEETLPEVETIESEGGKVIIEERGSQSSAVKSTSSPPSLVDDDPSAPSPQPPSEDKEEVQRKMKALFAAMNDYGKAIKKKEPDRGGNLKNEIEEMVRENMNLAYNKFSMKNLSLEELDELRNWINAKTREITE